MLFARLVATVLARLALGLVTVHSIRGPESIHHLTQRRWGNAWWRLDGD